MKKRFFIKLFHTIFFILVGMGIMYLYMQKQTDPSGPTVFSGVANGQPGQGLPDPVPADYKGGIYLVPQYSNRGFTSVKPE